MGVFSFGSRINGFVGTAFSGGGLSAAETHVDTTTVAAKRRKRVGKLLERCIKDLRYVAVSPA